MVDRIAWAASALIILCVLGGLLLGVVAPLALRLMGR